MHLPTVLLWIPLLLPSPGPAAEVDASVGIYYFSSDEKKVAAAQMERGEGGQAFPAPREPREIARDFAKGELVKGNVCLRQAEHDLQDALRGNKIAKMCRAIYKGEIAEAAARARAEKLRILSIGCEAAAEARETPGEISVVLSFRASVNVGERMPEKLARAGLRNDPASWGLSPFEATMGKGAGWKAILKNRSCSLDSDALDEHFEAFLQRAQEERAFAGCRARHEEENAKLSRMQERFQRYVPDDWMKDVAGDKLSALLSPEPATDTLGQLQSCRKAREAIADKLERLSDLSESIASKHDIPALNPKSQIEGIRRPASSSDEKETD